MCRWLSYTGSPVLLDELLYKPKHSLIVQSLHATMGAETTNGDGFGVGWYTVIASRARCSRYALSSASNKPVTPLANRPDPRQN